MDWARVAGVGATGSVPPASPFWSTRVALSGIGDPGHTPFRCPNREVHPWDRVIAGQDFEEAAADSNPAARSISSSVVNRPTLRRTAPLPTSGGTRIAHSTGDWVIDPSWQALPVEAATPGTLASR